MSHRHFDYHIKSLLHFDYPYYSELNDGLNDEINGNIWARSGNAQLVGEHSPAQTIIEGTPKFGYRCLYTQSENDFISSSLPAFSLKASGSYEFFCFVRPTASQQGTIISLTSGDYQRLTFSLNSDRNICSACSDWNFSAQSSASLSLNEWHSLALRLAPSQLSIIIDGTTETFPITSRTDLPATGCRIGGFNGQVDEFIFRDSFSTSLPTEPVQATLHSNELGGFGEGSLGNVVINSDCIFTTSAKCSVSTANPKIISLSNTQSGFFGNFALNDEILILNNETGEYVFRTITGITQNIVLNEGVYLSGTSIQAIKVLHFSELTINAGVTVKANQFTNDNGGVIAMRCKGNCTINGKIITSGLGRERTDTLQLTHAKYIDNFLPTAGGSIMIFCGGTLALPSTSRLGAEWDGSYIPDGIWGCQGVSGGAGYGGGGSAGVYANWGRSLASSAGGGVGGGGAPSQTYAPNYVGAKPGFSGDNGNPCGANIILIARTLNAAQEAISSGGQCGNCYNQVGYSGGGTGFCYIACERMI